VVLVVYVTFGRPLRAIARSSDAVIVKPFTQGNGVGRLASQLPKEYHAYVPLSS